MYFNPITAVQIQPSRPLPPCSPSAQQHRHTRPRPKPKPSNNSVRSTSECKHKKRDVDLVSAVPRPAKKRVPQRRAPRANFLADLAESHNSKFLEKSLGGKCLPPRASCSSSSPPAKRQRQRVAPHDEKQQARKGEQLLRGTTKIFRPS